MQHMVARLLLGMFLVACASSEAGHELPYYPSYYPQEIRIEVVDPAAAATRLRDGSIHAYIGTDPFPSANIPESVSHSESLGSYVVATFNVASDGLQTAEGRCATAQRMLTMAARQKQAYVFHPYPITPYHGDYLHHFDIVESAKQASQDRAVGTDDAASFSLRVRANGPVVERLLPLARQASGEWWDVSLDEIDIAGLARTGGGDNGLRLPWAKEGWFHAYRLLASHLTDRTARQGVDAMYRRLVSGLFGSLEERLTLEREILSLLTHGCERVVIGYTVQREYFNAGFSEGIENIARDGLTGLVSPVFIRTLKLKDFPWNGWLRLGVGAPPAAAWNPIGGFTDDAGRLIWFAVGDPAFLPAPNSSSWLPNRISADLTVEAPPTGDVAIPRDTLLPEPGTGFLREVGEGKTARAKIIYRVLISPFHDGSRMGVADLLYPYMFAFRWSSRTLPEGTEYDPSLAESTAAMRERFAGLKVLAVEQQSKLFGELTLTQEVPVIEVYANYSTPDPRQLAALTPPWSQLPWHLYVLKEEAVKRGLGAFSREEAKRRGVPWLDLVRDQRVKGKLASLVSEFEAQGYRPDVLQAYVTEPEARERWAALKSFYQTRGHFLVTNGPYMLDQWSETSAVLQVFRDLSYPLGIGSFDYYAVPARVHLLQVEKRGDGLEISAEVEKAEKFQRTYEIVREPLHDQSMVGVYRIKPSCRYVVLSDGGEVLKADTARHSGNGRFTIDLQGTLRPGAYTILVAMSLNENEVDPAVKLIEYRVHD